MAEERTRTTAQATAEGLRVFLAGVPWHITEETLRRDFEECGTVEDLFLMRDYEGNSKGRAFITFREKEAVDEALQYDNTDYAGRKIFVKLAEARKVDEKKATEKNKPRETEPTPPSQKEFPAEKPAGCRSLCLKNLGEASEQDVRKALKGCDLQSVRLVTDRKTGTPRGIAFVDFVKEEDVDKAMARNGKSIRGQAVAMSYEAPRERVRPDGCLSVAVKKLPAEAAEADVKRLFKGLKSMDAVRVIRGKDGNCNGLAFVEFKKEKDVEAAVQRDGMKVKDNVVFICYETKGKTHKERPPGKEGSKPEAESKPKKKKEKDAKPKKGKKDKAETQDGDEEVEADESAQTEKKEKKKQGTKRKRDEEGGEKANTEADAAADADAPSAEKKMKKKVAKKEKKKLAAAAPPAEAEEIGDGDKAKQKKKKQAPAAAQGEENKKTKKKRKTTEAKEEAGGAESIE